MEKEPNVLLGPDLQRSQKIHPDAITKINSMVIRTCSRTIRFSKMNSTLCGINEQGLTPSESRLWCFDSFFGRRTKSHKQCFQAKLFVGIGKNCRRNRGILTLKERMPSYFQECLLRSQQSYQQLHMWRTHHWLPVSPRNSPEQPWGTFRIYLRCNLIQPQWVIS